MITQSKLRRLLAIVMAALICVSILPWSALAAESDSYTLVTDLADITAGGEFVLVAQNGDSYVALSNSIKGKPDAVAVTVSGGAVTGSLPVWTIAPIAGGGVSLHSGSSYLKYASGTNLGSDTAAYDWTVSDQGGIFRFSSTETPARGIGYQISGNRFGGYAVSNAGNGYVFDLLVFKKASAPEVPSESTTEATETTAAPTEESSEPTVETTAPTEPEVSGLVWNKVALADIASGDTIAITMTKDDTTWALYNANGTGGAPTAVVVTVSGDTMTSEDNDTISWNIVQENGTLVIYVAGSTGTWLYSTNTNNGTRVGTNDNKTWVVDAASGYLKHEGTGRYLGVYTAKPDWRSYTNTTGNTAGQTLSFWRLGASSGPVEPTEPETEPTEPTTEPTEPETEPTEPSTEPTEPVVPAGIADGDYVIWVPAYNLALSSTKGGYNNFYNEGVAVTETDGTLSGYGKTEVWTVTNQADGTITISQSGQNLGLGDSYTSMDLGAVNDKWTLTQNADGTWNVVNVVRGNTLAYSSYGNWEASAEITEAGRAAVKFTPAGEITEEPEVPQSPALESGDYVIWVPAYNMSLSSEKTGYYNVGVAVTLTDDVLTGYGETEIWTVTVSADGKTCTISQNGQNLGMADTNSSMNLGAVNDVWEIEPLTGGLYNLKNQARGSYMEWYASKSNWSTYGASYAATDGQFQLMLTPVEIPTEVDTSVVEDIAQWSGGYTDAAAAKLYADGDKYVDGDKLDTSAVLTVVANGKTVSPYYLPGANGYMGGSNVGKASGDYVQLAFSSAGWGEMTLAFRLRATNAGPGSFQLCYSTDGGSTWTNFITGSYAYSYTQYTSTGSFPVNKSGSISDGVALTSMAPGNYIAFSFDIPAAAEDCENLLIRLVPSNNYQADGDNAAVGGNIRMDTVVVSGSPIVGGKRTGWVDVTPNGETDQPTGTALTMTCATEGAVISYRVNGGQWQVYDPENKPTLDVLPCNLEVKASAEGKTDSVTLLYQYKAGTVQSVTMDPNGGGVYIPEGSTASITLSCSTSGATIYYAASADGETYGAYQEYTGPIELNKGFGKLYVKAYAVKAGYNDSIEVTRTFTERASSGYTLYFGQLHSHTNISDGSGTVEQAFQHAYNVANLDFLAVTDHSNYFDNHLQGALGTDGTTISTEWAEGHAMAEKYTDATFVGLYGFEMTWSGGSPGHINTFNTPGWQSRNQSQYANKTAADLLNYYETLASVPQSISQFNHPGTTFGDFYDFGYYSESADNMITLIEVGNGEGAIGSSGYFPSYEYYTRALDKGWHVAPTNNQDNHRGNWGSSNTGRTVVLADALTEEGIYDALRNRRVYATEDNDLSIRYTLNGYTMGADLEGTNIGSEINISVAISDPTDSAIGKVEVIVNGGLSVASEQVATASSTVTFQLQPEYSYYYIKITQPDGDIAVTAPVWVGEVEDAGITSFEAEPAQASLGQEQNFALELYNNEASDLTVSSIVYTDKATGTVIYTETGIASVVSGGTGISRFAYTFPAAGVHTVTATVTGTLGNDSVTYTKDLEVIVLPGETLTPIADVRASAQQSLGEIFTVEGYVTAGTTNVATTFFDTIYIQDATGGIAVFPYGETGLELGTKVRITGYTDSYQGDIELQIISMTVLEDAKQVIEPAAVSNKDAMDYAANGGELLKVQGEVTEVTLTQDGKGVSQFTLKDESGDLATVFVNGYIFSGTTGENTLADIVKVGNTVSAVGLGYVMPNGSARSTITVLRVRDCDEVILISEKQEEQPTEPTEPETEPTEPETEPTEPETEPTEPETPEGVIWTKTELADIQPGDTVAITMTAKDGTTYVLSTVMAKKGPSAPTGTISGDKLILAEADSENAGWNIVPTDGGFCIQTPDGAYLYSTNSNSGVKTGDTAAVWTVAEGYLSSADTAGNTRYMGVYTTNPDWRAYKTISSNIADQALNFWILEEVEEPTEPTEPETEPTEPETEPTEPETEPTEPETEPTEPETEPTEPETEPTEPETEPTEPETEPTEPETEPTEPETEPTEPETEPTEPETEPTEETTEPTEEATQPTKPGDSSNAQTGDTSNITTMLIIMLIALIALAVLLVLGKKLFKRSDDEE